MRKIELLAPAGDLNRCRTAIRYGADAVYLGGTKYSLRSRAGNFSMAEIQEACRFAQAHGSVIHVTVNEIPHEEDFEGLQEYLKDLEEAGVTAVIEASPAIMALTREAAPGLAIHCSTQMSVTNAAAAAYLASRAGIDRVVLARECTLAQVEEITHSSPVETEAFIHGGMCVNFSGRCTLSNRMTLRDANRGGCAQSCRWSYDLYDGAERITGRFPFTMGSRDLMAADEIAQLMAAGVTSLKIEGRMKTEYYVASIVSAYRHLIDEIAACGAPLPEPRMQWHRREIAKAQNRETCAGFYEGRAGAESIIYHEASDADVSHGFLATVQVYHKETGTAEIITRNPMDPGMRIEVLSPGRDNREFTLASMRNDAGEYLEASRVPMRTLTIPVPFAVQAEDILRRADL